jgi:ribonuclease D
LVVFQLPYCLVLVTWGAFLVNLITSTGSLKDFCNSALLSAYVTIDTEFLREKTYYSKLCLIQMAFPGDGVNDSALIDVQSENIDLNPIFELFENENILKVFHAARQDLEIFYINNNIFPKPFFDTQVAAMVCGFGEQVGYETLARKLALVSVDKSSRFTNWAQRPLSDEQLNYAISDVTHLRTIYEELRVMLDENERSHWVDEELAVLLDPKTYLNDPLKSWKRIKLRNNNLGFLALIKSLANFRETEAQSRNIPRNRVLRDEMILELASMRPKVLSDLKKSRLLNEDSKRGWLGQGIMSALNAPIPLSEEEQITIKPSETRKIGSNGLTELLKVLLKANSEKWGVAQKLIASSADLDILASGEDLPIPALNGWRKTIFGEDALKLKLGKIALSAENDEIKIIDLD